MVNSLGFGPSARLGLVREAMLALALGVLPAAALGQDDGASMDGTKPVYVREQVTVTARKQEESLQEVPVAVTAIGGSDLERFQMDEVADLETRVPTLRIAVGGSGSGGTIALRGVGSSPISGAFDSAVAFNFDGVVMSTMRLVQSAYIDMKQIEVLKGPQSLFFGKSASAGVISFRSANPTDEWEFGGRVGYEFEEKGGIISSYVSGPVSDNFGFRLAAQVSDVKQLNKNFAPVVDPNRGEEHINVRATFQLDPSDDLSVNLKLNYLRHESDGAIQAFINCGPNGMADDVSVLGGAILLNPGYECHDTGTYFFVTDQAPPLSVSAYEQDVNGGVPYVESDIFFGVLRFDWEITDDLTLSSVTGYVDMSEHENDTYSWGGVVDGMSFGGGTGLSDDLLEQFTQEIRLTSNFDHAFNFMFGAFYEHRQLSFRTNQAAVWIPLVAGPDPVTGYTMDWYKDHATITDAFSVFGSLSIDLADKLKLTGGARWTHEKKVNTITIPYVHAALSAGGGFVSSGFDSGPIEFKDSNVSPEVTLAYQASDDLNFYGAFKTGFKSGGIDNSALPSAGLLGFASDDPEVRAATADALIFKSETVIGGEIGMKSQWQDRALTINIAAYYFVFDDLQVQNFNASTVQFFTSNAGELTSKGLEMDFYWQTHVEGLSFFGAFAYTDTKFTDDFIPLPGAANVKGRRLSIAPEWTGNFGVDLRVPMGNALELGFTGNAQFSSSYYLNNDSFTSPKQSSFATVDLTVSIGDPSGGWQLAVIGRNLSDKHYANRASGRPFLGAGGDDLVINADRGRRVTLEASLRF